MKKTTKRRSLLAIVSLLIVACMTLPAIPVSATATTTDVWDGSSVSTDWYTNAAALENDGTEDNPYEINTAADLAGLASLVNAETSTSFAGKYIVLTKDLDLNNKDWTPIGGIASGKIFKGIFDGQEHTISNLNTEDDYKSNNALFGNAQGTADNEVEIKNLTVVNAKLWGSGVAPVAAVVKYASITNVHFSGTLDYTQDGSLSYIGGIVSKSAKSVTISNCSSSFTYKSASHIKAIYLGGILAYINDTNANVSVENCSTDIEIDVDNTSCTAAAVAFGGIIGYCGTEDVNVSGCNSEGKFIVNNPNEIAVYVSGIVAYGTSHLTAENCSSTVEFNLTNVSHIGGIVGYNASKVAETTSNTINNCYTNSKILNSGDTPLSLGGIAGCVYGELSVSNCIANGDITLTDATDAKFYVGGIVANAQVCATDDGTKRTITDCIYTGNISVTSTSTTETANDMAVGGIAGKYMNGAQIHNSAMYGTVVANYENVSHRTGLFAGAFGFGINGAGQKSIITNCLCVFPETTENPIEFNKSGNTQGTTLRAIGAASMSNTNGVVEAGSITIIRKTSSDIDVSFEGVQQTAAVDFDHDNDPDTAAVKANDIRFVATLGDAGVTETESVLSKYSSVGFVITAVYGTSIHDYSQDLNHVYTSIKADGEDVTATELGGDYIVALTGKNIPAATTDTVTFYVTPKLTTADGTGVVYGATTTLVFIGGVYQTSQS